VRVWQTHFCGVQQLVSCGNTSVGLSSRYAHAGGFFQPQCKAISSLHFRTRNLTKGNTSPECATCCWPGPRKIVLGDTIACLCKFPQPLEILPRRFRQHQHTSRRLPPVPAPRRHPLYRQHPLCECGRGWVSIWIPEMATHPGKLILKDRTSAKNYSKASPLTKTASLPNWWT
jgi:hypothetical protein